MKKTYTIQYRVTLTYKGPNTKRITRLAALQLMQKYKLDASYRSEFVTVIGQRGVEAVIEETQERVGDFDLKYYILDELIADLKKVFDNGSVTVVVFETVERTY